MKSFIFAGLLATAAAYPKASSDSECSSSSDQKFSITTVNATETPAKRTITKRQLDGPLMMELKDGKLTDQAGRTGYIASNYQFQFDAPVQADARESEGFGLCSNGSLSLMGSTMFYSCKSGEFYNLYSKSIGGQCIPIHMQAIMSEDKPSVTQITDGQPQASKPAVTQISDGQPQASAPVVTQISDGQPQASSPVVTQISDGQPQASAPVVTQISDGQPQASAPVVTQISDGQPQASAPVVTQISDGQPQASAPVVTQISDGQPQASAPVVTQISDGQPQASAPVVTQISDGQPQASAPGNYTTPTKPAIPEYTGAAATGTASISALAAAFLALFAFV